MVTLVCMCQAFSIHLVDLTVIMAPSIFNENHFNLARMLSFLMSPRLEKKQHVYIMIGQKKHIVLAL